MDIQEHWETIRFIVKKAMENNRFCAVATVNPDGSPRISPIGSLTLGNNGNAYYYETFPKKMRENLDRDKRICVLAVQGGFWYWLKALLRGRFDTPIGVRLMGRVGARRMATQEEMDRRQERMKRRRKYKMYKLLWKDSRYVRDISFDEFEPVHLGLVSQGVWEDGKK